MRAYIIAEAGISHNSSIETAEKMIVSAKCAGADCVKFQSYVSKLTAQGNKELEDILLRSYFGKEQLAHLKEICGENGIDFLCSAFEEENLDWLVDMGETRVKIPSCRNMDEKFLVKTAQLFDKIYLSTGMMTTKELYHSYNILLWADKEFEGNAKVNKPESITVLQCTSAYPCPMDEVNLMGLFRHGGDTFFQYSPLGFSDHTVGWEVPVAAVALGAQIIEKHFTLSREGGVDDCVSLEPDEFADMVGRIRNVEKAMGSGIKKIEESERCLLWRKK